MWRLYVALVCGLSISVIVPVFQTSLSSDAGVFKVVEMNKNSFSCSSSLSKRVQARYIFTVKIWCTGGLEPRSPGSARICPIHTKA